jgi:phosphoglycerol transferase MdoB-like AlkP superfamily enzyme
VNRAGATRFVRRFAPTVALAAGYALLAWWLDRRALGVAPEAYFDALHVFANALPGLVAALLLVVLTRRPLLSLAVVAGLQVAVYQAQSIKLHLLNDPIGLQDVYFLSDLSPSSLSLLGHYIEHPLLLGAAVLAALALLVLAWRLEKPAFRAFRATHALLAVIAVALPATLVMARQPWSGLYDEALVRPSRFGPKPAVLRAGLMSSLVYDHLRSGKMVGAVDEPALARLFRLVPPQPRPAGAATPDAALPDIVIILSESLFDPTTRKGMASLPDTIPVTRAAIASGAGGYMSVPAFGGGTVRTEFEIMTGMPVEAFPEARFPYVSLVRQDIPSLVSALEAHGYRTVAVHGNAGSFWNRRNAYKAMGMDRFITRDEFPADAPHDGLWISDAAMTDVILAQLRQPGPPRMVLALSMETHGPYKDLDGVDTAERDAVQVPAALAPPEAEALRNYLYHAHHADAQLGRLMRALRANRRPAVVLFFGDHLPALPKVYARMGFVDGRSGPKQEVPWVLWRSDRQLHVARDDPAMESWMLPGLLLQAAGVAGDPYFSTIAGVVDKFADATPAQRHILAKGMQAAAVARMDGTFAQRRDGRAGAAR